MLLPPRRVLRQGGEVLRHRSGLACARDVRRARALGLAADEGDLLGLAAIAMTSLEKAKLRTQSGAVAIDLESHIVDRRGGASARWPFLVLRAVCDPARFALPPAAVVGLDAAGRAAPGPVLPSLLRRPGQMGALLRLARHSRAALKSLARAAAAL